MSTDPDQIRSEIDRTREDLSTNVNALTDEIKPSTIAKRQVEKARSGAVGVKDKIMGSAQHTRDTASDSAGNTGQALVAKAQGNPLAVGLVAFGIGLIVASLIPTTEREQHAATDLKDKVQPFAHDLADSAKDAAANLKEPAQDAVAAVKESATGAASTVRDESAAAAHDVKGDAQDATASVRDTATS